MIVNKQLITIKGTREGLTLYIDDSCSFSDMLKELDQVLSTKYTDKDEPMITVTIQLGNRYLHKEQEEELREVIRRKNKLVVQSIESNVILKKQALDWMEDSEIKTITKIVRSGQVLEVTGDLLLVGDVNPGAKIVATGNIFVLGSLRGVAHAGVDGNRDAVIVASYMEPSQLRIADYISRSPDYESEGVSMECGFIDGAKSKIVIDRLQVLSQKRPDLNGFERRILHG
ncbi:septum site-determining protein MinC [Aquibacillus koreensis]|uniref:Probable septum site-determining protein MinC n=1 Tax=Aquibacillus koreensis TaxID=279446 RepID=A0A9X4AGK6_9BACI|nr:septum site-determining protein MinC [Aquibacillus koreensis]MCT2537957.1 septum site-determining protein MinC [Aquibacillus koreensis]MDC3419152.1 septum site-determining protein MinC [Aquibacillus koreensis]